jgi:hypothetical protein
VEFDDNLLEEMTKVLRGDGRDAVKLAIEIIKPYLHNKR